MFSNVSDWIILAALAFAAWFAFAVVVGLFLGRLMRACSLTSGALRQHSLSPLQKSADLPNLRQRVRILGQLERLKELYLVGDLTRDQYAFRKQVLQHELAVVDPPQIPDVTEAAAALTNFGLF